MTHAYTQAEEELEQAKKRLWVKEREAQMLQKQVDSARVGSSDGRSGMPWRSAVLNGQAGADVLELQRRLAATENVLAERTQRLRDVEEQLGVQAECGWAQREGFRPMSYDGRQPWPAPAPAVATEGAASRRADPLSEAAGKEEGTWMVVSAPAGPTPLPPPAPQQGHSDDWLGEMPVDEPADVQEARGGSAPVQEHSIAASSGAASAAPAERGVFQGLSSRVTNSVSGLTSRSLAWSSALPFLGSERHPQAAPPVSPAPAILPKTPPTPADEALSAVASSTAGPLPSSASAAGHGMWGGDAGDAGRLGAPSACSVPASGWVSDEASVRRERVYIHHNIVCVYVSACVHIYIHTHIHTYTHTYIIAHIHVCVYVCVYVYMHTRTHIYTNDVMMSIYMCVLCTHFRYITYTCLYILHVCVCIYMSYKFVYPRARTHKHKHSCIKTTPHARGSAGGKRGRRERAVDERAGQSS